MSNLHTTPITLDSLDVRLLPFKPFKRIFEVKPKDYKFSQFDKLDKIKTILLEPEVNLDNILESSVEEVEDLLAFLMNVYSSSLQYSIYNKIRLCLDKIYHSGEEYTNETVNKAISNLKFIIRVKLSNGTYLVDYQFTPFRNDEITIDNLKRCNKELRDLVTLSTEELLSYFLRFVTPFLKHILNNRLRYAIDKLRKDNLSTEISDESC